MKLKIGECHTSDGIKHEYVIIHLYSFPVRMYGLVLPVAYLPCVSSACGCRNSQFRIRYYTFHTHIVLYAVSCREHRWYRRSLHNEYTKHRCMKKERKHGSCSKYSRLHSSQQTFPTPSRVPQVKHRVDSFISHKTLPPICVNGYL